MWNFVKNVCKKFVNGIWGLFLYGLLTILPITLTIIVFGLTLRILKSWLEPIRYIIDSILLHWPEQLAYFKPTFLIWIPYSEIIVAVTIIFLLGFLLKVLFLHSIINAFEQLITKIPLVRPVYSGIKQLVHAFNPQDEITFKKVVMIEFPRPGMYSLGFLTSELIPELAPNEKEDFFNIFVPTTPNPTSGYFIILPKSEIIITDLTRQEAMALIISGGIIQPACKLVNKRNFT